jgi:hypothetical protein
MRPQKSSATPPPDRRSDEPTWTQLALLKGLLASALENQPEVETQLLIELLRRLMQDLFLQHPEADAEHRQAAASARELEEILKQHGAQQAALAKATAASIREWAERAKLSGIL